MASRVTITGNMREVSQKYLAQANRGPVQMGFLMGSAVSSAAEQIAKNAIYASPVSVPLGDAYRSRKGRQFGKFSKTKIVSRTGEVLASMRKTWWSAAKESADYSLQTPNMAMRVQRGSNATICSWRGADGGKIATLENGIWRGRQEIPGQNPRNWPIISGRPRRFVNKRWSAMLRVIRKTFDEYISLQANMSSKMPSRPVVPRG